MWEKTQLKPIQPPSFKKQRVRPKKMRRKELEEHTVHGSTTRKLKRHYIGMSFTNCSVKGHNKATYANNKQSTTTNRHV